MSLATAVSYGFPVAATATGVALLAYRPVWYFSFCWWVWFLTPGLRRLVDFQDGWNPTNPIMLAPVLVTGVVLVDLVTRPSRERPSLLPYAIAGAGVVYAYCVGLFQAGFAPATYDMLGYGLPIAFAAACAAKPERLGELAEATRKTFLWGLLLLGAYGCYQYAVAPDWDVYWMLNAPINTVGTPEPFGVRVFGTLNAPQPFAMVMMAGLLVALARPGWLGPWAGLAGAGALVLSLVRSAWGGWLIGALFLFARASSAARVRALVVVLVLAAAGVGVVASGFDGDAIAARVATMQHLTDDESFNDRLALYAASAEVALLHGVGTGLGAIGQATKLSDAGGPLDFDSGLLVGLLTLGWPGVTLYALGFWMVLKRALDAPPSPEQAAGIAVTLAMASQLVFTNTLVGVSGLLTWSFLALATARKQVSA